MTSPWDGRPAGVTTTATAADVEAAVAAAAAARGTCAAMANLTEERVLVLTGVDL